MWTNTAVVRMIDMSWRTEAVSALKEIKT
ncbi:hypothetical protein BAL199_28190 [alpha proteobacterium BAL199]|nr:hypothetical protein BAL199_28190 [alpha proteobacterium BAL199]